MTKVLYISHFNDRGPTMLIPRKVYIFMHVLLND